jgi:hypothetical protein
MNTETAINLSNIDFDPEYVFVRNENGKAVVRWYYDAVSKEPQSVFVTLVKLDDIHEDDGDMVSIYRVEKTDIGEYDCDNPQEILCRMIAAAYPAEHCQHSHDCCGQLYRSYIEYSFINWDNDTQQLRFVEIHYIRNI